jgi:hypothetical protein
MRISLDVQAAQPFAERGKAQPASPYSPSWPSIAARIFRWWSSTAHLEELSPRCALRP